jgi:hypothetical protein
VREGHALELERAVLQEALLPAGAVEMAEPDELAADLRVDAVDDAGAVEVLAAVAVAVDRQQDLRLDLREAVDDAAGAELGRRGGPDRPERGGGHEGGDGVGDVREVAGDAVAPADAAGREPGADLRRARLQVAPRPGVERAQLRGVADGDAVVRLVAEQVARVADLRAREPLRAGHRGVGEDAVVAPLHAEEVPDRRPEALEVVDGPAPQRVVVVMALVAHEARHGGVLEQLRVGSHRIDPSFIGRSYPPSPPRAPHDASGARTSITPPRRRTSQRGCG